jgi:hypothetical protein
MALFYRANLYRTCPDFYRYTCPAVLPSISAGICAGPTAVVLVARTVVGGVRGSTKNTKLKVFLVFLAIQMYGSKSRQ